MSTQPIQLVPAAKVWNDPPLKPRRELLWIKEGKKCHWCGCPTRFVSDNSWDKATTDHVLPRYKGGNSEEDNLVSACNRCNNRRNHEDHLGLPEGHLLGKFKASGSAQSPNPPKGKPNYYKHVALTRDEKQAIMGKSPKQKAEESARIILDPIRLQRDKALQTILELRKELKQKDEALKYADEQMKSMTIGKLIRRRIGAWLLT